MYWTSAIVSGLERVLSVSTCSFRQDLTLYTLFTPLQCCFSRSAKTFEWNHIGGNEKTRKFEIFAHYKGCNWGSRFSVSCRVESTPQNFQSERVTHSWMPVLPQLCVSTRLPHYFNVRKVQSWFWTKLGHWGFTFQQKKLKMLAWNLLYICVIAFLSMCLANATCLPNVACVRYLS